MVNRSTDYVASTRLMPITKDDQSSETLKPIYSKFQCRICNCNRCHQTVYHLTMYTVQLLAQNQQNLLMLLVRRGQICVSRTLIIGLCLILSLDIVDFSITMVFGKLASTMTSMAGLASASTPSSVVHSTNSASCLETVMGMGMVVVL